MGLFNLRGNPSLSAMPPGKSREPNEANVLHVLKFVIVSGWSRGKPLQSAAMFGRHSFNFSAY